MNTTTSLGERTVGELAVEMPISIRVFEAWRIDYCCGGNASLPAACAAAGKTVEAFVAALEALAAAPDSAFDWASETLTSIGARIEAGYHRHARQELDTLAPLADRVLAVHGERKPELAEVSSLVRALIADMLPHMLKEEQLLFPYVRQMEIAVAEGHPPPPPFFGTVKNPVRMMMLEHDRVGGLLARLRHITADYAAPEGACFSYRELYRRLAEFQAQTHEHIHVENNVYFPGAIALEERAGARQESGAGCAMPSPGR